MIRETRSCRTSADPETTFAAFTSLGGDRGWLFWSWAWSIRGALDRFVDDDLPRHEFDARILLAELLAALHRQTEAEACIVEALRRKGLPFAYIAFEGEQHGFRKAANIIRAQEAELYFYGRVFGFDPADEIEPVEIENLD